MASHSPAPWEYHPAPYGWDVWANTPEKFRQWITPVTRLASPHKAIFDGSIEVDAATCEANARLISAAPDLLEALCRVLPVLEATQRMLAAEAAKFGMEPDDTLLNAIRAAIAKAEGADLTREVS